MVSGKSVCIHVDATDFERSIEQGYALDNRQTFAEYAAYVIDLKERTGTKHRTVAGYWSLLTRTNQAIGHLAIQDIRPTHLNQFYKNLAEVGIRETAARAIPRETFRATLKEKKLSMAKVAKLAEGMTLVKSIVVKGKLVSLIFKPQA